MTTKLTTYQFEIMQQALRQLHDPTFDIAKAARVIMRRVYRQQVGARANGVLGSLARRALLTFDYDNSVWKLTQLGERQAAELGYGEFAARIAQGERCHASRDGECIHPDCPQRRDNEPRKTGRHCPLDVHEDEA